jgi:glycosyltransferase involved in cell wall biosynthesis
MSADSDPIRRQLRIGIVIPTLHGGGAESIAREWVTELLATGHSVTAYLYGRESREVNLETEIAVRHFTPRGGPLRMMLLPAWLRFWIGRDELDVVFSLMTLSNVMVLLGLKAFVPSPVPVIVSEHNIQSLQVVNVRQRDAIALKVARGIYRRATGALAVSHPVAGELVAAFQVPIDKIFVVPNPVVSREWDRSRLTMPRSLHLVFVGRLVAQKRPHLFVEVLAELARRGISVRGTMLGDGPLRESTELAAASHALDIEFLGWVEPWWDAISDADCLVLTANAEGFANVLVEAAAAGIPSVASSRAVGVGDAIVPGVTGEFALSDSPQAYVDAVLSATRLGPIATDHISGWLSRFTARNSTATLTAVFHSVCDAKQS